MILLLIIFKNALCLGFWAHTCFFFWGGGLMKVKRTGCKKNPFSSIKCAHPPFDVILHDQVILNLNKLYSTSRMHVVLPCYGLSRAYFSNKPR